MKSKLYELVNNSYELQRTAFIAHNYILAILYIALFLGFSTKAPIYIETLHNVTIVYICAFLIYRFNPYNGVTEYTDLDRMISFSAGIFILVSNVAKDIILYLRHKVTPEIYDGSFIPF